MSQDISFIKMVEDSLFLRIGAELQHRLFCRLFDQFKEEAEAIIKAELEKVVYGRIESFKEASYLSQDLKVYVSVEWKDEPNKL